jgi:hypothetical protein
LGRLVARCGVERAAAEKAVGIMLQFLAKEASAEQIKPLIDKLPGADAAIKSAPAAADGMFGIGGIMGVGSQMMAAGLSMSQIQTVTQETIGYAREKVEEEAVGALVGAIPGLGQFV